MEETRRCYLFWFEHSPRVSQTDRRTCLYSKDPLHYSVPRIKKVFFIFKIRRPSISEKILQKLRLITRKIIFIVPAYTPGSQKGDNVPLTPLVHWLQRPCRYVRNEETGVALPISVPLSPSHTPVAPPMIR